MKTSKTLTSAIVATALVGAIGMAYAQSDSTQPMTPGTSGQAVQNQPSSDTTSPTSADTSFQTERPAQADRN